MYLLVLAVAFKNMLLDREDEAKKDFIRRA